MKRNIVSAILSVSMLTSFAESFNITIGNITYSAPVSACGEMTYSGGKSLSVLGKEYLLSEITRMTVDDVDVEGNTVSILYSDSSASVRIDARIAQYLDVIVEGANVSISQHDEISTANCGEITYILSGSSSDGQFRMTGSFKSSLSLNGLDLKSTSGAAIDIQNGKRIKLNIADGTVNKLQDGVSGSHKGAIVCKGHLEIQGSGSLDVSGNTAHAIYAKEYISLETASISVTSAVKDGINCNQYFDMKSGSLSIENVGDDGIQVSFKDDTDRKPEDTGSITISGGNINVSANAVAAKGIKADGNVILSGGVISASVSGHGKWDSSAAKTKAAACISADGDMTISGGIHNLTATGGGGKGINVDGNLNIAGGDLTVNTSGGLFAYVNGTEYPDYKGNTDNLDSDLKSSPKGIKADGDIIIDNGRINITASGIGAEGIESKAVMTVNGGEIKIKSYDDGLNSSSHMYLRGGDITVVASGNDAIDSNGNMYIEGGFIRAFGAASPECGIDANEEEGYSVIITGGTLIAVGGGNSTPRNSTSTQPYVNGNMSLADGKTVILKNGDNEIVSFDVPEEYVSGSPGGGFGPGDNPGGDNPGGEPGSGGGFDPGDNPGGEPGPGGGFGPGNNPGGEPGSGGGFGPGNNPGGNGNSSILISCPDIVSGSTYTMTSGDEEVTVKAILTGNGGNRPW